MCFYPRLEEIRWLIHRLCWKHDVELRDAVCSFHIWILYFPLWLGLLPVIGRHKQIIFRESFFSGDCLPKKHYCIRVYLRNMNRKANLNICLLWILFLLENNLSKFNSLSWEWDRGADIGNSVWWKHASAISSSSSYWHLYQ